MALFKDASNNLSWFAVLFFLSLCALGRGFGGRYFYQVVNENQALLSGSLCYLFLSVGYMLLGALPLLRAAWVPRESSRDARLPLAKLPRPNVRECALMVLQSIFVTASGCFLALSYNSRTALGAPELVGLCTMFATCILLTAIFFKKTPNRYQLIGIVVLIAAALFRVDGEIDFKELLSLPPGWATAFYFPSVSLVVLSPWTATARKLNSPV